MLLPTVKIGDNSPDIEKAISFIWNQKDSAFVLNKGACLMVYIIECEGRNIGLRKRDLMKIEVESL